MWTQWTCFSLGIDCDAARNKEENVMLADAKEWLKSGEICDKPHPKTGATAMHVAAAKGYIQVMKWAKEILYLFLARLPPAINSSSSTILKIAFATCLWHFSLKIS